MRSETSIIRRKRLLNKAKLKAATRTCQLNTAPVYAAVSSFRRGNRRQSDAGGRDAGSMAQQEPRMDLESRADEDGNACWPP
jgi:hypothetical protein